MPAVTGKLTEVSGGHLVGKAPEIHFTLNAPNAKSGVMLPTEPLTVAPATDGSFTANLQSTEDMMDDAFYTVSIQWLDAAGNYVKADFPQWKIRVPLGGGAFSDLFGSPPKNSAMIYVSLSPPTNAPNGAWWLEDDPTDPDNPLNTGNLHQLRKV